MNMMIFDVCVCVCVCVLYPKTQLTFSSLSLVSSQTLKKSLNGGKKSLFSKKKRDLKSILIIPSPAFISSRLRSSVTLQILRRRSGSVILQLLKNLQVLQTFIFPSEDISTSLSKRKTNRRRRRRRRKSLVPYLNHQHAEEGFVWISGVGKSSSRPQ